jgi:hypothetical protein
MADYMTYLLSLSKEELDAGWSETDVRLTELAPRLDQLEALGPSHADEASSVRAEITHAYRMQVDIVNAIDQKCTADEPETSSSRKAKPSSPRKTKPSSSRKTKPSLSRNPWTLDEDLTLARSIIDGLSWQDIADSLPTRTLNACQLHVWQLKLEDLSYASAAVQEERLKELEVAHALAPPKPRTFWTDEEDGILVQAYQEGMSYGKITEMLGDRTVNACVNRLVKLGKTLPRVRRGRKAGVVVDAGSEEDEGEEGDVEETGMGKEEEAEEEEAEEEEAEEEKAEEAEDEDGMS